MSVIIGDDQDTAFQVLRGTDSDDLILTAMLPDDDDLGSGYSIEDILRVAFAGAGDDMVKGRQNVDELHGGPGMDSIRAGRGDDLAWGGRDDDQIAMGGGDDWASGGLGSDTIEGDKGSDTLFGNADDDYLNGGPGADRLHGGAGSDALVGGHGPDTFVASDGADVAMDFDAAEGDILDLDGRDLLGVTEAGGSTMVAFDGGTMTLIGVTDLLQDAIVA